MIVNKGFSTLVFLVVFLFLLVSCGQKGVETPTKPNADTLVRLPDKAIPANDRAKGLVFDGLHPGAKGGPCEGLFELDVPAADKNPICTHGPDPAPEGVDVRAEVDLSSLAVANAGTVPCIGDGTSGYRVQAVYTVAADQADRYDEVAPLIKGWAAEVNQIFVDSATEVGEERHVRFVTDANCELVVEHVVLSPTGDDTFGNMIGEMKEQGYNSGERKYLVWMDASVYCGLASIYGDDRPEATNLNNGNYPMFARVDSACWGGAGGSKAEAHELMHNLGGVQRSAPHATDGYHCTEETDIMCYKDAPDVIMEYNCDDGNSRRLDCNHDDYYHPHPPANSYLATHWNTANSRFLHAGAIDQNPPPPSNAAPIVEAGANQDVELPNAVTLSGTVSDDGLPTASALQTTWSKDSGPGVVTFTDPSSPATTATFSVAGTYTLQLLADDSEMSSLDTMAITVTESAVPTIVTETFSSNLNRKNSTRSFSINAAAGTAEAVLTFDGGKGKKSKSLTLKVYDSQGQLVKQVSGGSPVNLNAELAGGNYVYEVSGDRVSFVLTVTYTAP